MLFRTFVALPVLLLATSEPIFAQDQGTTPPPEKCRATPQPENQDRQKNKEVNPQDQQSLTEKLDPCNGVLKPPAVGDQEMTRPAPDVDNMPEVKPRDLPGQQPSPEQK